VGQGRRADRRLRRRGHPRAEDQAARALEGYVREFPNRFVQFLKHLGTARLLLEIEEASGADVAVAILGKDSL
jgi:hypothetical protein